MDELLDIMKPEEIRETLWFVEVCERGGGMEPDDAAEWKRRILARHRFLGAPDPLSD